MQFDLIATVGDSGDGDVDDDRKAIYLFRSLTFSRRIVRVRFFYGWRR